MGEGYLGETGLEYRREGGGGYSGSDVFSGYMFRAGSARVRVVVRVRVGVGVRVMVMVRDMVR